MLSYLFNRRMLRSMFFASAGTWLGPDTSFGIGFSDDSTAAFAAGAAGSTSCSDIFQEKNWGFGKGADARYYREVQVVDSHHRSSVIDVISYDRAEASSTAPRSTLVELDCISKSHRKNSVILAFSLAGIR